MKPHIVGFIDTSVNNIMLNDVVGIYADRGKPRKEGYWVKSQDYDGKISKSLYNLTYEQYVIIKAASHFNQILNTHAGEFL